MTLTSRARHKFSFVDFIWEFCKFYGARVIHVPIHKTLMNYSKWGEMWRENCKLFPQFCLLEFKGKKFCISMKILKGCWVPGNFFSNWNENSNNTQRRLLSENNEKFLLVNLFCVPFKSCQASISRNHILLIRNFLVGHEINLKLDPQPFSHGFIQINWIKWGINKQIYLHYRVYPFYHK